VDRLEKKNHAVGIVAEGAGYELLGASGEKDTSGNAKLDAASLFIEPDVEVDAISPPVDVALLITLTQLFRVRRSAKPLRVRDSSELQILG
jgi:hypothetical protein